MTCAKMSLVPQKNSSEKDDVMTPPELAQEIVDYFAPDILATKKGRITNILDPCCGERAFPKALEKYWDECSVTSYDIKGNVDFLSVNYQELGIRKFDWIISNPPWSKYREFTKHAYKTANNILWLVTINHVLALKARLRDMKEANFGIRKVYCVDTPKEFPQSGFQLAAIWLQEDYKGDIKWE